MLVWAERRLVQLVGVVGDAGAARGVSVVTRAEAARKRILVHHAHNLLDLVEFERRFAHVIGHVQRVVNHKTRLELIRIHIGVLVEIGSGGVKRLARSATSNSKFLDVELGIETQEFEQNFSQIFFLNLRRLIAFLQERHDHEQECVRGETARVGIVVAPRFEHLFEHENDRLNQLRLAQIFLDQIYAANSIVTVSDKRNVHVDLLDHIRGKL